MEQYRRTLIPRDDTVSFPRVARNARGDPDRVGGLARSLAGQLDLRPADTALTAARYDRLVGQPLFRGGPAAPRRRRVDIGAISSGRRAAARAGGACAGRAARRAAATSRDGAEFAPFRRPQDLGRSVRARGSGELRADGRQRRFRVLERPWTTQAALRAAARARWRRGPNEIAFEAARNGAAQVDRLEFRRRADERSTSTNGCTTPKSRQWWYVGMRRISFALLEAALATAPTRARCDCSTPAAARGATSAISQATAGRSASIFGGGRLRFCRQRGVAGRTGERCSRCPFPQRPSTASPRFDVIYHRWVDGRPRRRAGADARASAGRAAAGPCAGAQDAVGRPRPGRAHAPPLHPRRAAAAVRGGRPRGAASHLRQHLAVSTAGAARAVSTGSRGAMAPTWAFLPAAAGVGFRSLLTLEAALVRRLSLPFGRQCLRAGTQAGLKSVLGSGAPEAAVTMRERWRGRRRGPDRRA